MKHELQCDSFGLHETATASFDAGLMTYFREAVVNTQEMLDLLVLTQC